MRGKTALVRIDLNSSVRNGKVVENARYKAHAETITQLKKKYDKIILLSHQGRKGDKDYLESLEQHAGILNKYTRVKYVHGFNPGSEKCVLLKNVRSLPYETETKTALQHSRTELVRDLAKISDVFLMDAFSVAHRNHCSVVGFTKSHHLPCYAGPLVIKEIKHLGKLKNPGKPFTVVLGGAKLEEALVLLKKLKADKFLLGGLVGETGLVKAGFKLGKKDRLIKKEWVNDLKLSNKIFLPIDLVLEDKSIISINELPVREDIVDIGPATIRMFSDLIKGSRTVLMKGPLGVFEKGFGKGTLSVMKEISKVRGLTVLGGGHSTTLGGKGFSFVSTGGGAMIDFLSGKKMPGLVNLKNLKKEGLNV